MMATEFKFPDVGEGVTEGTLLTWLVEEGDTVEEDESLAEVETDKAVVEVPAPHAGTVQKLHAEEGETIKVGNVLVTLGEEGEDVSETEAPEAGAEGDEAPAEEPEGPGIADMTVDEAKETVEAGDIDTDAALEAERSGKERTTLISWLEDRIETEAEEIAEEETKHESTSIVGELEDSDRPETGGTKKKEEDVGPEGGLGEPVSGSGKVLAAPSTRKLAREKDVDITTIEGTGPGGRVTREDVERAASEGSEAEEGTEAGDETTAGRALATPAVRRLAKEQGVDIDSIAGTGPGGRVTEEDVTQAATGEAPAKAGAEEAGEAAPAPEEAAGQATGKGARLSGTPVWAAEEYDFEQYGPVEREELSRTRRAIAEHMERSYNVAPHVTATDDADVTELWEVREKEKEVAATRDVHLTFMPFLMKAVISALKDYPMMNASLDEQTEELVKKQYYNIGVAVATDRGLLVPVVKNADQKSILGLAREANNLAEKARNKEIALDEMRGGTFTITNYGSIGGRYGTPILNYPEVGILGVGTIRKEPVVVDDEITIRRMMPLSLTFDHRVIDGAYAAQFMNEVVTHLEDPDLLLIDE